MTEQSAAASLDFGLEPRREQVSYAVEYRRPGGQWTFSHTPDSNRAESGMLLCDRCSMVGDAGKTARAPRKQLREYGWRTSLPGGRDLCPDCAEKEGDDAA